MTTWHSHWPGVGRYEHSLDMSYNCFCHFICVQPSAMPQMSSRKRARPEVCFIISICRICCIKTAKTHKRHNSWRKVQQLLMLMLFLCICMLFLCVCHFLCVMFRYIFHQVVKEIFDQTLEINHIECVCDYFLELKFAPLDAIHLIVCLQIHTACHSVCAWATIMEIIRSGMVDRWMGWMSYGTQMFISLLKANNTKINVCCKAVRLTRRCKRRNR